MGLKLLKRIENIKSYKSGKLKEEYSDFFSKYSTYEGYLNRLEDLADKYDFVSNTFDDGSMEGRIIPVSRVSSDNTKKPNQFMFTGLMHGREFIGGEVCMGVLEKICSEQNKEILENAELYFIPVVNPDALVRNIETVKSGSRYGVLQRQNANGIDLNRNFKDEFRN